MSAILILAAPVWASVAVRGSQPVLQLVALAVLAAVVPWIVGVTIEGVLGGIEYYDEQEPSEGDSPAKHVDSEPE